MATRIKRVPIAVSTNVADAISTGFSMLEELGNELREVCDNTPENLQGSDKYSARDEAASTLEGLNEPEAGEVLGAVEVKFELAPPKRNQSRSSRRDEAVRYLQEALDVLQAKVDEQADDDTESLITEIQDLIDEAEGVEFTGML